MGIAVIDYGMGNLRSVSKALETVGAETEVTKNPEIIARAKGIVLPGVGAFSSGMENLKKLNIIPALFETFKKKKPFLGICLGLQLLFSESEEYGVHRGLDIIKGKIKRFNGSLKVPHMGWNQVKTSSQKSEVRKEKTEIFEGIPDNSYFYFVHSYYVEPEDKNDILATTDYGIEFVSAIQRDNIFGVQFHPEKSGDIGLQFLKNFLSYVG